jgi:peptide/nickel transport system substrate-binding protein
MHPILQAATLAIALTLAASPSGPLQAATLRVASQGDVLSMDPHSLAEAVQLSFMGNIHEGLVIRDRAMKVVPGLATSWKLSSPTVWRFELRRGVTFHDGAPFTADDVVFSINRARGDGSDMKSNVSSVKDVRKVGDFAVEIETTTPNPILPDLLSTIYVMNKAWATAQGAEKPVDRRKGIENTASFKANGTGPYRLRERQPGVRSVLVRHLGHWAAATAAAEGNVDEVIFTPIGNDATRLSALVSGEMDLIDPVPLQDIPRLQANDKLKVMQAPESRVVYFGFDQKRDELLYSSVKGKNPFKDKRVRQAVYQAIDIDIIFDKLMRKSAKPTAMMIADSIRGYSADQDKRLPFDPTASKRLLTEAGYPDGFEVTLNCPNDRLVNDGEICQAVAAQLARVGIKVRLQVESKNTYFPKVLKRDTSFFMGSWSPVGFDAHNALYALMATPEGARGTWNLGAYSNPKVDALTTAIQSETDEAKRNAMIKEALQLHSDDIGHIPLHQQFIAWGMRKQVQAQQRPDNFMMFKWISVR